MTNVTRVNTVTLGGGPSSAGRLPRSPVTLSSPVTLDSDSVTLDSPELIGNVVVSGIDLGL